MYEKLTRAACRRSSQNHIPHIPRATKFGDVITADHKVLSEERESRNSQRYAIVVQASTTSQDTARIFTDFLDPEEIPKVIFVDNSLEFGTLVKISSGTIVRLHLIGQNQWNCRKSSKTSQRGHFVSSAEVRTRGTVEGRIHENVFAVHAMSKVSYQRAKTPCEKAL